MTSKIRISGQSVIKTVRESVFDTVIYSMEFWIFFMLTVLILITSSIFQIPGIVEHPQFGEAADPELLKKLMQEDFRLKASYYLFFFLDFFWALFLLLLVWKFVNKQIEIKPESYPKYLRGIFGMAIVLAYLFDVLENFNYLFFIKYNALLTGGKLLFYFIVAIIFLLSFLRYFVQDFLVTFLIFLKSSIYSIIVLIIIGVLLPTASQVNSIVVDLYLEPWNLLILLVLGAPFFAIVLAHYPSYFNISEKQRQWYMAKATRFIFGIVHYRYNRKYNETMEGKTEGKVNFLFRFLGICFYAALFYMIAYTSETNFGWLIKTSSLSLALLLGGAFLMYHLKQIKDNWYEQTFGYLFKELPIFYDGDYSSFQTKKLVIESKQSRTAQEMKIKEEEPVEDISNTLRSINKHILIYIGFLGVTILVHIVLFIILFSCTDCRYSETTVVLSLICIALQTITFVFYRVFRSLLKFTFFNSKGNAIVKAFLKEPYGSSESGHTEDIPDYETQKSQVLKFFKKHDFKRNNRLIKLLSALRFGAFSNNVHFLQFNALVGIINAVFFVLINLDSSLSISFNSILIIMSALYLYYGILVVFTKTYIYYKNSEEEYRYKKSNSFTYFSAGLISLLVIANILVSKYENNLFTLDPIDRDTPNEVALTAFTNDLDSNDTRYYIGCYGGGMKSNAWTLTVLNELYNRDSTLFDKTVGISGVSGGTMGLINMSAIMKNNPQDASWGDIISSISTENILSLDLTHALGRDTFDYLFVPFFNLSGYDRSSKAMERYAFLAGGDIESGNKISYRKYWSQLYEARQKKFPVLISNTTNVKGNQGMAVSVKVEDLYARSLLYHKADDILEINRYGQNSGSDKLIEETLDYYDAASTSNRFPILSPAAKIETKGHYNDGGIYENSGLLSAYKMFKAVSYIESIQDYDDLEHRNVFISIVNDKNQYILKVLEEYRCKIKKINSYSETSSILSSIASTEMMPIFVKTQLDRLSKDYPDKIAFETIYLPHRFNVADVKSALGKEVICNEESVSADAILYDIVKSNNSYIESLISLDFQMGKKPIIEPPVSRVMAEPAYDFMKSMLDHRLTKKTMDRIRL